MNFPEDGSNKILDPSSQHHSAPLLPPPILADPAENSHPLSHEVSESSSEEGEEQEDDDDDSFSHVEMKD